MPNMFDVESVHKVLSKLRPDKAMGPDGIASMLLIETRDVNGYPSSQDPNLLPEPG